MTPAEYLEAALRTTTEDDAKMFNRCVAFSDNLNYYLQSLQATSNWLRERRALIEEVKRLREEVETQHYAELEAAEKG